MPPNNDEPNRIFDVAKPGQTAASAQSKPVIVGHRTLLQDPMVTPKGNEAASGEAPKPEREQVQPIASTGHTLTPPTAETDMAQASPETADIPNTPTTTEPDIASVDSEEASKEAVQKQTQRQEEAETTKQEVLHKLVEDKKYYVPIGEKRRTRSIRRLLVAVIIALAACIVLADLFIDSGTIKTSIKPPVRIFHHNQQ